MGHMHDMPSTLIGIQLARRGDIFVGISDKPAQTYYSIRMVRSTQALPLPLIPIEPFKLNQVGDGQLIDQFSERIDFVHPLLAAQNSSRFRLEDMLPSPFVKNYSLLSLLFAL